MEGPSRDERREGSNDCSFELKGDNLAAKPLGLARLRTAARGRYQRGSARCQ
jgi:hypothetical protein